MLKNPILAPEKSFFKLLFVNSLGHEFRFITIKAIVPKTAAIHVISSPTTKNEHMRFIGSKNIYSIVIDKFHVNMKSLYNLLHDNIKNHWITEMELLSQQNKTATTKDVTMKLPNTNHHFFVTVDSPWIGTGCVFFQLNDKGKLDIISDKCPNFYHWTKALYYISRINGHRIFSNKEPTEKLLALNFSRMFWMIRNQFLAVSLKKACLQYSTLHKRIYLNFRIFLIFIREEKTFCSWYLKSFFYLKKLQLN